MKYPLYAQRDKLWAKLKLGNGGATIGSDGCLISSIASATGRLTPPQVNDVLKKANLFRGSNVYINTVPFERLFGNLRYGGQTEMFYEPVPAGDMNKLRDWLRKGHCAIVMVDSLPAMKGIQYHYMLAVGFEPDTGEIVVNDPWYGITSEISQINRVWWKRLLRGIYGKTSAEAIWRIDYLESIG